MSKTNNKEVLLGPLNKNNPTTVQVLGIRSTLAVAAQLEPTLVMALSVMVVIALASVIISLLCNTTPNHIRIIMQLAVVAALVTIVNEILKAYVYDVSKRLSVYIGLIITNCVLMDRLEAFALAHGPKASFLGGIGNDLDYGLILVIIGFVRELFDRGSLLGFQIIPQTCYGMGYVNHDLMTMSPVTLIVLVCIVWAQRGKLRDLQEK